MARSLPRNLQKINAPNEGIMYKWSYLVSKETGYRVIMSRKQTRVAESQ